MENRNGLAVGGVVTQASGTAGCEAAPALVDARPGRSQGRSPQRITLGADKAYDVTAFVEDLRARSVSPHIAINGPLRPPPRSNHPAPPQNPTHPCPRSRFFNSLLDGKRLGVAGRQSFDAGHSPRAHACQHQ